MKCHSRRPVHIALLSQFFDTGSCRTWRARGAGGPALLRLPGAPRAARPALLPAAAHRHGRQRPRPGRGGGSGRRLIGRSAGPRGRCRGRRGRRGGARRMGGRAGFFEVGAGGAGGGGRPRRGEPGPGPPHPAAGGRGCPGSRRAPLSSPSICIEAPGSRSHPLPSLLRCRSRAERPGGTRCSPGVSLGREGKRSCRPPRPLLSRARSPRRC